MCHDWIDTTQGQLTQMGVYENKTYDKTLFYIVNGGFPVGCNNGHNDRMQQGAVGF